MSQWSRVDCNLFSISLLLQVLAVAKAGWWIGILFCHSVSHWNSSLSRSQKITIPGRGIFLHHSMNLLLFIYLIEVHVHVIAYHILGMLVFCFFSPLSVSHHAAHGRMTSYVFYIMVWACLRVILAFKVWLCRKCMHCFIVWKTCTQWTFFSAFAPLNHFSPCLPMFHMRAS